MNDQSKTIRWGILGLGKIAHKFADDLRLTEGVELLAVASRDMNKAEQFAKAYGTPVAFGSYQELAQADVDVIYIATPHPFHVENALMCIQHGKAVLCEKPMGIHPEEVERLIAAASDRKLFLMEGLWTRFIPATEKLLELIDAGYIGNIERMEADFGFKAERNPDGRLFNKALGGGALLDIGVYPIYLSLLLLGEPQNIAAKAQLTEEGVDGACAMQFAYVNGANADLSVSLLDDTPIEATIHGTKGTLKLHRRFHHSEKISWFKDGKLVESFHLPYRGNGYVHEILEVNDRLRKGKTESDKLPLSVSLVLSQLVRRVNQAFDS